MVMANREDAFARFILDEAFRTGYVGSLVDDHGLWMVDLGKSFETYLLSNLRGYEGVFSGEYRDVISARFAEYSSEWESMVTEFDEGIYLMSVVADVYLIVVVDSVGDVTINRYVFGSETTEQDLDKLLDVVYGIVEATY